MRARAKLMPKAKAKTPTTRTWRILGGEFLVANPKKIPRTHQFVLHPFPPLAIVLLGSLGSRLCCER